MEGKVINLIGQKFGKLTIIKGAGFNKWRRTSWLCKCECGNTKIVAGECLKNGHTKSCGCLQRGREPLPLELASMRAQITRYKKQAKQRGLKYELAEKQFAELTQRDCYYCGAKPNNISGNKKLNGDYIYNGIDRIDSKKGYIVNNVVPCCKICNSAKSNMTIDNFRNWIERAYNKMREPEIETENRLI